jgi:hypothetical protein
MNYSNPTIRDPIGGVSFFLIFFASFYERGEGGEGRGKVKKEELQNFWRLLEGPMNSFNSTIHPVECKLNKFFVF